MMIDYKQFLILRAIQDDMSEFVGCGSEKELMLRGWWWLDANVIKSRWSHG